VASIRTHLALGPIASVTVQFAPAGNFSAGDTMSVTKTDAALLASVTEILGKIPASGSVGRRVAANVPRRRIELTAASGPQAVLTFHDDRLQSPAGRPGLFYASRAAVAQETRLLNLIRTGFDVRAIDMARPGTYRAGRWTYSYKITHPGTRSEGRLGELAYDGTTRSAGERVNDYYLTPWGRMYWVGDSRISWGLHRWMPQPVGGAEAGRELSLHGPPPERPLPVGVRPPVRYERPGFDLARAAQALARTTGGTWRLTRTSPDIGPALSATFQFTRKLSATYMVVPFRYDRAGQARLGPFTAGRAKPFRLLGSGEQCTLLTDGNWSGGPKVARINAGALEALGLSEAKVTKVGISRQQRLLARPEKLVVRLRYYGPDRDRRLDLQYGDAMSVPKFRSTILQPISAAEARAIISHLQLDGFLSRAVNLDDAHMKIPDGPVYIMTVRNPSGMAIGTNLGTGTTMIARMRGLQSVLSPAAAASMERILRPLTGHAPGPGTGRPERMGRRWSAQELADVAELVGRLETRVPEGWQLASVEYGNMGAAGQPPILGAHILIYNLSAPPARGARSPASDTHIWLIGGRRTAGATLRVGDQVVAPMAIWGERKVYAWGRGWASRRDDVLAALRAPAGPTRTPALPGGSRRFDRRHAGRTLAAAAELLKAFEPSTPREWRSLHVRYGQVTPYYRPGGPGVELLFRPRTPERGGPPVVAGGEQVSIWLMGRRYNSALTRPRRGGAREIAQWGRYRVFGWGSGHWADWERQLLAALQAAGTPVGDRDSHRPGTDPRVQPIDTDVSGAYTSGLWAYGYTIRQKDTRSEARVGRLVYNGRDVRGEVYDRMVTPWGTMQFYGGAWGGFEQGWLLRRTYNRPIDTTRGRLLNPPQGTRDRPSIWRF